MDNGKQVTKNAAEIAHILNETNLPNAIANETAVRQIKTFFNNLELCREQINCTTSTMQLALYKIGITREVLKWLKNTSTSGNQTHSQQVNHPDGRKIMYALYDVGSDKPLANEKLSEVLAKFLVDFVAFKRQVSGYDYEKKIDFELNRLSLIW